MSKIISWFSGGITSAVTCKLCVDQFGRNNVRIVFIDTNNESEDTYRFLKDCEWWYGKEIERLSNEDYNSIEEVWYKYNGLNFANGAICSSELKRTVRQRFQRDNDFDGQSFGFDINERKRALAMEINYKNAKPFFPLIEQGLSKQDCIDIVGKANIEIPQTYKKGYRNNNCFRTGCVQGGIGYWQKIKKEYPEKFDYMARIEHDLTNRKGKPVTMLRDNAKDNKGHPLFLKHHPDYPSERDISMKKGRPPRPLKECNGFCGINDLESRNETENEINYKRTLNQLKLF